MKEVCVSSADRPPSPLADRRFALLWSCVAAAYLAQWMLPVAAQWFLVRRPGGEALVPVVAVVSTLPMALMAIPVGVLADRVDRRKLVMAVQSLVLLAEAVLVGLSLSGRLQPWSLFVLLAIMSIGIVTTFNSLSSMVPDLVEKEMIPAASALLTIATNATRVIGPALAGFILAATSVGMAFAAAIPATALLLIVLSRLKSPPVTDQGDEGLLAAAAVGVRYVRVSPQARKLVIRTFWFTAAVTSMLAVLPILATDLGATATGLGLVLAAQGVGAVLGALTLPRMTARFRQNTVVAVGFFVAAVGLGVGAAAPGLVVLGIATTLVGWAWTTVLATDQAAMQMYLPAWVRARGLSVMMIATFSGQALGAALFGWISGVWSPTGMLAIATAVMLAGVCLAFVLPLKDLDHVDRSAVQGWVSTEFVLSPQEARRPVQVSVQYDVTDIDRALFMRRMVELRIIRLRTGARRWQLLADPDVEGRYHEQYMVRSWLEHEMQIRMRGTVHDAGVRDAIAALCRAQPITSYSFRVPLGVPV
ncbi:MFS transporter [Tsukamurella sp. PLM1]|uniref:MFS transporter n=1 Tax=Tsukamurella sp. PLM1 TaxID=2929795 RepID=UPI0020BFEDFB|nr:MFS transporter [Tsukamurella sp. PLM1]